MSTAPIGVFDSGFGGLSVLQALVAEFPSEKFIYLGDTARIPYGIKSPGTVSKYLKQNLKLLHGLGCKAAVVACNTASTVLVPSEHEIPVVGVISPGAELAVSQTKNLRIGVMATRGTVLSKAYVTEIHKFNPEVEVFQNACPLLVPLVEENWVDDPVTNIIVYRYVQPLMAQNIDTLVLGCTHYPFLMNAIEKVTGHKATIVRSGPAVAKSLRACLKNANLLSPSTAPEAHTVRLLTTDISPTYVEMAKRLTSNLIITPPELVEL